MNSVSFDDLVTAATVGVARKELAIGELRGPAAGYAGVLDAGDRAAALLEAAALLVVARRAGVRPARGVACPAAAADDGARELPPRAARALRRIGRGDVSRGFAAADAELLADLLSAARDAGYVAAPPLLPDLLDAAVRTAALRPVIASVLGARGRWLAGHRADWRQFAGEAAAAVPRDDAEAWRTGSREARRAHLVAMRDRDPDGARELLAAGWARETGDDRAVLLAVLGRGLAPGDEEFLEAALDDRAGAVRDVARRLLARLPGSAFSRRAAERAAAVLRLEGLRQERHGPRRRLVATLPGEPDDAAVRDGIDPRPPSPAIGARAWLLTQVIAGAPLAWWTARFGLTPEEIVALPVEANLGTEVRAGWRLAAAGQRDGAWAQALLGAADPDGSENRPPAAWPTDPQLAAALPADVRAERTAALLLTGGKPDGYAALLEVTSCPVPWPPILAGAVITVLRRFAASTVLPRLPRGLLDAAKRGLPATGGRDYAAELTQLADHYPQTWSPLLHSAAETISLRRAFLEEIR